MPAPGAAAQVQDERTRGQSTEASSWGTGTRQRTTKRRGRNIWRLSPLCDSFVAQLAMPCGPITEERIEHVTHSCTLLGIANPPAATTMAAMVAN